MPVWAFMTSFIRTSNFVIYTQYGVYKTKLQWRNQIPNRQNQEARESV
jgi:hypothetical protein